MAFSVARRWPHLLRPRTLTCDQAEAIVQLFDAVSPVSFGVRLWDGRRLSVGRAARVTFGFGAPETFIRCIGSEDPAEFAEAYADGRLTIEGDLGEAVSIAMALGEIDPGLAGKFAVASRLGIPVSRHSVREDERDVRAHYDLSNAFFELFLDKRMVYSCAYFATPSQSLDEAQARKLDLICRKLGLGPGDAFLDVGCGWGGLLIWAAGRHGVRAHGLTLSMNQEREARRRIAAAGLEADATVERSHYERLPPDAAFDAVASVGMYEHVGLRRLSDYCRVVYRALRPGGRFLNHGITQPARSGGRTGGTFIFRHIFPGAELVPVSTIQAALEEAGFEIVDVHSLRPHYALTLRAWFERFQRARTDAIRESSERLVRTWEVYLAGCAQAFDKGFISVHQILAVKPGGTRRPPPLARETWEVGLAS